MVLAIAAVLATGCAGEPAGPLPEPAIVVSPTVLSGERIAQQGDAVAGGFLPPPSSAVLARALRTDLCALLDASTVARFGWQPGARAETLTSCGAGSADQRQSVVVAVDTAVSDRPAPAEGNRCTRLAIVDPVTMIALKVQVRAEPEPCRPAEELLATAVQRFTAGAGEVRPPHPWLALDACQLLPPLLATSARTLGGPNPTLREVRRLGARGCVANHVDGEVTLSVAPAPGRAEDLDGTEVAVGGRPARRQELAGICVLRLVGSQLVGPQLVPQPVEQRMAVQVITVEVRSATRDTCAVATALAEAAVPVLPAA